MDTITNGGKTIGAGSTRGNYYPLDGRRETHPAWMAGNVKRLDPFQDAVPCWQTVNAVLEHDKERLESVWDGEQMVLLYRCTNNCVPRITDRPLADYGLTSYRYKGRFGWIMIGARNTAEALSEAKRSTQDVDVAKLEVWNGYSYVAVK